MNTPYQPIRKCLFPAAGFGTRFLPATKSVPKEMLPVVNKPLIHYGVEEALEAGMNEIAIVYGRHKEALIDYFDNHVELEQKVSCKPTESLLDSLHHLMHQCRFTFTRQRHMRGLGDAIYTGRDLIGNNPFAVLLADDLCFGEKHFPLHVMQQLFMQHGVSIVLVEPVAPDTVHQYGIVEVEDPNANVTKVTNLIEKPQSHEVSSNLAIIGRYILTPDIFTAIEHTNADARGEIQITDALAIQAKQGKLLAYTFAGKRFDCGQIGGMVEASNYVYQQMKYHN